MNPDVPEMLSRAGAPDPLPEGEETAPPGTRAMGIVRWALVAAMAGAAAAAWSYHARAPARGASQAEARYRCPMHPSVIADRPGACPICGMDLVSAGAPGAGASAASAARPSGSAAAGAYYCPMHPEVASDDPEATCPKCGGMKLVPRPAGAAAPGAPGAGVAGLVPIDVGPERVQLIGVRTATVARGRIAPALRALGVVTAAEGGIALVTTRFSGWIESLGVSNSGEHVRKGDVLARISSPDLDGLQLAFLSAVQWLQGNPGATSPAETNRRIEREARTKLLRAGVSEADVEEIARTGKLLPSVSVRAPVSGYVGKKSAIAGLYVQPGTELFEIADLSRVWVVAEVPQSSLARVRVGQAATISVPALPGETFAGRVSFLYPALAGGGRTLQARVELENRRLALRPGMDADVTLRLAGVDGLAIPEDAIVDTGDEQYVFVAQGAGRFAPRRVRLGARGDGRVQVLEGLAEGEAVVTTAQFLLDSESRLRAALEGSAPAAGAGAAAVVDARGP